MNRVLVVFHRAPWGQWRSTYDSHLNCLKKVDGNEYYFLNSAWPKVPDYLKTLNPDLVIFHYTFLAVRQHPDWFERQLVPLGFIRDLPCNKALVPHDEQAHADLLCSLSRDFGVTHIFSPASSREWPKIYQGLDLNSITFRTVLTGYIDEKTVARYAQRAANQSDRPIDVGYRSWSIQPSYGRHGLLKREIGRVFKERAPELGLSADISDDFRDAFLGESWFDFLLRCKYTIGVEGGTSILDFDGSYSECGRAYLRSHPDATFEEVEEACFPGVDGEFDYFLLGPRHLEAVLTKTCQVLIEGEYGGTMEAGRHYIPLKKDFSNLDEVLELMRSDERRGEIVERAYRDVILSRKWTYDAFARMVLETALAGVPDSGKSTTRSQLLILRNRISCNRRWEKVYTMLSPPTMRMSLRAYLRDSAVRLIGEERLWRLLVATRNAVRKASGRPALELGVYIPTAAESVRRKRRSYRRSFRRWVTDALVLTIGEERLWRTLVRLRNLGRRVQRKPLLDSAAYEPTAAELERREATAKSR